MTGRDWWTLARGVNVTMGVLTVLLGALIVGALSQDNIAIPLLLHSLSVAFFMAGWNALNDLQDINADRINHPTRPLASGAISEQAAKIFSWVCFVLSTIMLGGIIFHTEKTIGHLEWLDSAVIWGIALILMSAYEFDGIPFNPCLKKTGLYGNLSVSGLIAVVIVFGAAAVGHGTEILPWSVAICAMMIGTSREIIKDVEDMDGDSERHTLPMKIGAERARMVAWICALLAFISMGMPFALDLLPLGYIIFLAPALISLTMVKAPIVKGEDTKASKLLKRSLLFGLLGFTVTGLFPILF
jgi:geranylgeranylglycerol-phosphate geranylgeranyltransferase